MARKTAQYTVTDNNRDNGKTFLITEMPAAQAEAWAMRAILALMEGKVDLPEGFELSGMAGIAQIGIKALAGLRWEVAEPLLDEMFKCVQAMPNPANPQLVRNLIAEDIEEVSTRMKLRLEVWKLHTAFLQTVDNLKSPQTTVETKSTRNAKMSPIS